MSDRPSICVFDLGNVVIEWDRRRLFGRLIHDPAELDHFLDHVFTMTDNAALDRGATLHEVTAAATARHPEYAAWIDAFRTNWIETLGPLIVGTVELIDELRTRNVPRYALSNFGAETFAMVEDVHPFGYWFDGLVISGREGTVKPEPEIFELLCSRFGFEPREAVFIDDSVPNVEAAARIGFDTILFEGADLLRSELETRRLI